MYLPLCFRLIAFSWLRTLLYSATRTLYNTKTVSQNPKIQFNIFVYKTPKLNNKKFITVRVRIPRELMQINPLASGCSTKQRKPKENAHVVTKGWEVFPFMMEWITQWEDIIITTIVTMSNQILILFCMSWGVWHTRSFHLSILSPQATREWEVTSSKTKQTSNNL